MEALAGFILLIFLLNLIILRYFVSQLSKKISLINIPLQNNLKDSGNLKDLLTKSFNKPEIIESPNNLDEKDTDEIEFSEDNPLNLPKDIKFEIEGGDSHIPPSYSEAN